MKLTPQQFRIISHLGDGEWHCMAGDFFMKDDRTRISELIRLGYEIVAFKCDGRCHKKHSSRVVMRRLKRRPDGVQVQKPRVVMYVRNPITGQRITTEQFAAL